MGLGNGNTSGRGKLKRKNKESIRKGRKNSKSSRGVKESRNKNAKR